MDAEDTPRRGDFPELDLTGQFVPDPMPWRGDSVKTKQNQFSRKFVSSATKSSLARQQALRDMDTQEASAFSQSYMITGIVKNLIMTALQGQAFLISLGFVVLAVAQAQSGSLSGTVLRPDGKPAAAATVVLRKLDAGGMREQSSAPDGTFAFNAVSPGTYTVAADTDDFTAETWINVGPSRIEQNPHPTVVLNSFPKPATTEDPSVVTPIFVALVFAGVLFWFQERINLSYLRVPLVCWALCAALPWILYRNQHALLALREEDKLWAGIGLVFAAVAIWQSRRTLVGRFRADHPDALPPSLPSQWPVILGVCYVLLWLFVLIVFAINSINSGTPERQQFVSIGIGVGAVALFAVLLLVAWLRQGIRASRWLKWPQREEFTGWIPLFATLLAGLLTYGAHFWNRLAGLESGIALNLGSPIVHLLFLIGELCLALSALCLWLDRYRVPLFSILLLMVVLGNILHRGDYVFASLPASSVPRPTPAQALAGRRRVIVVAAAGGGVQAAAWAARVLGGLAEENSSFAPAVRLLSGVSGGSVGVLYFMNTYPSNGGGNGWTGDQAFRTAAQPLLDVAAWGLVRRDILRAFGGSPRYDRGWAIERVLAARSQVGHAPLSWVQRFQPG